MADVFPLPMVHFEEYLFLDDRPGYRMTFLVEQTFDGEIDRAAFDVGVAEASRRHPLLHALVKRRWYGRFHWVSAGDTQPPIDWGTLDEPVVFPDDPGIDLTRDVGVQFYVRVGNGKSRLITNFHHACCDGMGAVQFLSDVFAAYTRHLAPHAEKQPAYQPVEATHLLQRGHLPVHTDATMPWIRLFWKTLVYVWKYTVHSPTALAKPRVSALPETPLAYPGTLTRTLSDSVQKALRQVARSFTVTVNELLIRELLLTLHDWNRQHGTVEDDQHLSVLIPTDMRNLNHDQMPSCNVMSYVAFQRPVTELQDADKLLTSIREESLFYKRWRFGAACLDGLKVLRCVPGSLRKILKIDACLSTAILSCIGDPSMAIAATFPVNENGDPILGNLVFCDLNTAPPIRRHTSAAFTTWHYSNKLRLGVRCDSTVFTQETAQELLDNYTERVVALAATATKRRDPARVAA